MRKLLCQSAAGIGIAALSPQVLAMQEAVLTIITELLITAFVLIAILACLGVYFMRSRDKRRTPLNSVFEGRGAIHSVAPDTPVAECVRTMTTEKIGALLVMDGQTLIGIFTERDALGKVLAAGVDPGSTKVSEVMTRDPCCIPPTTTVGDAMQLITERRFRHLPIVENGKVLALVSSGDLTHWLVQDQVREVQELVELAARS